MPELKPVPAPPPPAPPQRMPERPEVQPLMDVRAELPPVAVVPPPMTASTPEPPPAVTKNPTQPKKVRVAQLHGYYDDLKRYREWHEGDVIDDPAEVALLFGRKAQLFDLDGETPVRIVWPEPEKK